MVLAGCGGVSLPGLGGSRPTATEAPAPIIAPPVTARTVPSPQVQGPPAPEVFGPPAPRLPGFAPLPPAPPAIAGLPQLARPQLGDVRVGLLLPLSGPEQAIGQSLLDAALLALTEIGNGRVRLLPRDTGGTAEGARAAAEAVLQEGAELILGPVFSAEVAAAAQPARARGINVIAFSTDAQVAGNGVYLMGLLPQQQVDRVVSFAASRGLRRFAALAPQTPYGTTVTDQLRFAASQVGGELTDATFYPPTVTDVMNEVRSLARYQARRDRLASQRRLLEARGDPEARAQLQQLGGLDTLGGPGYDALLIAEGGPMLRQIAPLLPFFDIDPRQVRFLGTGLWDDPTLGQEPSLVGGWFAAPPPESVASFMERFNATYQYRPVRIATLAYDSVALAAALARNDGTPDFGRAALTSPSGFAGTDGIFRFLPSGIAERGLAVLEVTARGARVIDTAANTFLPVTN